MADLNRLKRWLYHQRIRARLERDRAEKRQNVETAKAELEVTQHYLFDF